MDDKLLKRMLMGLGIVAGIGAIAYVLSDDTVQEKTEATINRLRAKHFVREHLSGNDKALQAIDRLDDEGVNDLLHTVDRFNDMKNKLSGGSDNKYLEAASTFKDQITDKTQNLLN
jgi:hypothetical protein